MLELELVTAKFQRAGIAVQRAIPRSCDNDSYELAINESESDRSRWETSLRCGVEAAATVAGALRVVWVAAMVSVKARVVCFLFIRVVRLQLNTDAARPECVRVRSKPRAREEERQARQETNPRHDQLSSPQACRVEQAIVFPKPFLHLLRCESFRSSEKRDRSPVVCSLDPQSKGSFRPILALRSSR